MSVDICGKFIRCMKVYVCVRESAVGHMTVPSYLVEQLDFSLSLSLPPAFGDG